MSAINFEHLRTFLTVVRLGGVGKASVALNLTQPAVSTRIKNLEESLGTPLVPEAGPAVLVDRGWVPAVRQDPAGPRPGQVAGEVVVEGRLRHLAGVRPGWFVPAPDPEAGLWFAYDLSAMAGALGIALAPAVVEAEGRAGPDGWPEPGIRTTAIANNHLQYAITWFGLALGLLGVWIAFSCRLREDHT